MIRTAGELAYPAPFNGGSKTCRGRKRTRCHRGGVTKHRWGHPHLNSVGKYFGVDSSAPVVSGGRRPIFRMPSDYLSAPVTSRGGRGRGAATVEFISTLFPSPSGGGRGRKHTYRRRGGDRPHVFSDVAHLDTS